MDRVFSVQELHAVAYVQNNALAMIAGDWLRGVQQCLQASAHEQLHDEDKLVVVRRHGPVDIHRVRASEVEHHLQFLQEGLAFTRPPRPVVRGMAHSPSQQGVVILMTSESPTEVVLHLYHLPVNAHGGYSVHFLFAIRQLQVYPTKLSPGMTTLLMHTYTLGRFHESQTLPKYNIPRSLPR